MPDSLQGLAAAEQAAKKRRTAVGEGAAAGVFFEHRPHIEAAPVLEPGRTAHPGIVRNVCRYDIEMLDGHFRTGAIGNAVTHFFLQFKVFDIGVTRYAYRPIFGRTELLILPTCPFHK